MTAAANMMPQAETHQDGSVHFFPLFKVNENGSLQRWDIHVETPNHCDGPVPPEMHGIIITRWGQEGGAQQELRETVQFGKNVGKKNETTAFEQALKDAKSKWEKQQKAKKYVASREAALAGERSEFVVGGYDPMLAFPREKKPKALLFPCDDQPKLDGHRCTADIQDGVCTLWSRTRKPIFSMPHIVAALEKEFPTGHVRLDGELYNHDLEVPRSFMEEYEGDLKKARFEYLTSLIRPKEPVEGHEQVQYHCYDTNRPEVWEERQRWLQFNLPETHPHIIRVLTRRANSEEDLAAHEESDVANGYEGLMARNLAGLYEGKRSPNLLKVKRFVDSEFEVVRVETDTRHATDSAGTREMVYAKFICKLDGWTGHGDEDHEFSTTLNGSQNVQQAILAAPKNFVGHRLTVKYQGFTAKNKPRFPKGLRFRVDL